MHSLDFTEQFLKYFVSNLNAVFVEEGYASSSGLSDFILQELIFLGEWPGDKATRS